MSKRERDGENVEHEEDQDKRQHRQDDGNIDAALLDEANQYDTATTAVANATYRDLIQHDEDEQQHEHAEHSGAHEHEHEHEHDGHDGHEEHKQQNGQDGEEEDEEEEEEEDMDDSVKDPDHVPEEATTMDVKVDDENEDEDDEADPDKKIAARRGRKTAPSAGSEEWKRQRKDSHKEVERRRRENINLAINKLSDLLPVKESSKATILARAAEYIQKLRETESANIDKWTLQKLLSEQNQSRLTSANERLQEELGKAYKEIETLKAVIAANGVSAENKEKEQQE